MANVQFRRIWVWAVQPGMLTEQRGLVLSVKRTNLECRLMILNRKNKIVTEVHRNRTNSMYIIEEKTSSPQSAQSVQSDLSEW